MSHRIDVRTASPAVSPRVEHAAAIIEAFLSDAAHVSGGFSPGIAFPTTDDEVAAIVAANARILPVGAQSSLTGGATPRGEVVLSTRHLTAVDLLDERHVRVGAGVPLATLQHRLAQDGLYYPPVPTFDGAFVGGTIATNAAGAATFKYGSTRRWVDAVTVVLATGAVLDISRGSTTASAQGTFEIRMPGGETCVVSIPRYEMPAIPKLSAGYYAAPGMDLIDLFIGSEGTLGVVTRAVLRVIRRPARAAALITCRGDEQALHVTTALREQAHLAWIGRSPLDVSAIEYMDARSLGTLPDDAFRRAGLARPAAGSVLLLAQMEVDQREGDALAALMHVLDHAGIDDDPLIAVPGDDRGAQRFFELREAVPARVNALVAQAKQREDPRIEKTAGDLIVPFDQLAPALRRYREACAGQRLDVAIWGHMSDGNLHVNVIPRTMREVDAGRNVLIEIARDVIGMGGAPLAEHGVGRSAMKQRLLRELYGDDGVEQMRAVKRTLDPGWKLSPGVLFPSGEH